MGQVRRVIRDRAVAPVRATPALAASGSVCPVPAVGGEGFT